MRWVTHAYAYHDRVASPWLIKRFVDPAAEFVFVPWGEERLAPPDAIPFALVGVELGEHDADGTTFQKILRKYELRDPILLRIGRIVELGVAYTGNGRPETADADGAFALALMTLSEGTMLLVHDDARIVAAMLPIYDALYASLKARAHMSERGESLPASAGRGPTNRTEYLRAALRDAGGGQVPVPSD